MSDFKVKLGMVNGARVAPESSKDVAVPGAVQAAQKGAQVLTPAKARYSQALNQFNRALAECRPSIGGARGAIAAAADLLRAANSEAELDTAKSYALSRFAGLKNSVLTIVAENALELVEVQRRAEFARR
jgi:hypothetical protein